MHVMEEKRKCRTVFLLAAFLMLNTACGQKDRQVPKLLEPEEIMSACRPVERGNVGDIRFLFATVVPMEYCSCFDSQVTVDEIYVSIGEHVKKGDVLAKADTKAAEKQLSDLKRQLDQEQKIYALNRKVAALTEEDLKKRIKKAGEKKKKTNRKSEENEETEIMEEPEVSEKDLRIQLAEHQENTGYDAKLHNYRVKKLKESLKEQETIVKEGTLKAAHDGTVSCIKDLSISRMASAGENIVVCYSGKKTYLEVPDVTVDSYRYQDYKNKYILAKGTEFDVQELEYGTEEMILAKINGRYPNLRFSCPKKASLKTGDTCPVYFVKERAENVLLVGNDSLHEDGSSTYVYVKDGDSRVRREVTTGLSDKYYTEIREGLFERELVYYESSVELPGGYEPYPVHRGDYSSKNHAVSYQRASQAVLYRSEYDGSIKKMAVEEKSRVKKGDLLYVIATGAGTAAIAEAENAVEQENLSYQKTMKEMREQEKELKKDSVQWKILSCQKQIAKIQHENTLADLQEKYKEVSENNDGKGNISVYAEESGTVLKQYLDEEDKLLAGDEVVSVTTGKSDLLLLQLLPSGDQTISVSKNKIAGMQEEVIYSLGKQKGTCVGYGVWENNRNKVFLYSDQQGAHLSWHGESSLEAAAFYVRMEDSDFVKNLPSGGYFTFNEYSLHDDIAVPADMVKTETDAVNTEKIWNYVWRIADGELVKQYVSVDETLSEKQQTVILSGLKEGDILAKE